VTIVQLVKKFPTFHESENSLPSSNEMEPRKSTQRSHTDTLFRYNPP